MKFVITNLTLIYHKNFKTSIKTIFTSIQNNIWIFVVNNLQGLYIVKKLVINAIIKLSEKYKFFGQRNNILF